MDSGQANDTGLVETEYPLTDWRLLVTPPVDGATNMAVDEAILYALSEGVGQPTLRFFQWEPPCLSLGYSQHCAEVDEEACRRLGYTWVRRPTGGRAILHTDELTYSVVVPETEPRVSGGIVESYRRLSTGLLAGLRILGADVFQAEDKKGINPDQGAACFDTPSNYEITVAGRKLFGSAQVRRRQGVLQHGTLPLVGDLDRIFSCLRQTRAAADQSQPTLEERAVTLEQALGRAVSFDEAARALAQGFSLALNLNLVPAQLTPREHELVAQLRRDQYAHDAWNRRT